MDSIHFLKHILVSLALSLPITGIIFVTEMLAKIRFDFLKTEAVVFLLLLMIALLSDLHSPSRIYNGEETLEDE